MAWYRAAARTLPWRGESDPYRVWLSETMLQQTRVATVISYYERFLGEFPTVADLAGAPLDRVLHAWQGLGYYSRARSLHRAARQIAESADGVFPRTAEQWRRLPGVGQYTAAAVASITAGEPVAAVDGNAKRVMARLFGVREEIEAPATSAKLWRLAQGLLDRRAPGEFNQALMDLGSLICTPRRPRCEICPLRRWCRAATDGTADVLPRRRARAPAPRVAAVCALVERGGRFLLVQRRPAGLLGGLWELPGVELRDGAIAADSLEGALRDDFGVRARAAGQLGVVEHAFTHRKLTLHVFRCAWTSGRIRLARHERHAWLTPAEISAYALATLDRKALAVALRGTAPLPSRSTGAKQRAKPRSEFPRKSSAPADSRQPAAPRGSSTR